MFGIAQLEIESYVGPMKTVEVHPVTASGGPSGKTTWNVVYRSVVNRPRRNSKNVQLKSRWEGCSGFHFSPAVHLHLTSHQCHPGHAGADKEM
jgi:hypothetical protein